MASAFERQAGLRRAFALALAVLVLVRLLAPVGFMPVRSVDGVAVLLCSGQAATIDIPGEAPAKHKAADSPCAFAFLPLLHVPPLVAAFAPDMPRLSALLFGTAIHDLVVHRLAAPPPPAQAPPSLA